MSCESKPLIKWPGGKRALLTKLFEFLPEKYATYYEPFFGGGAFFFGLKPENAVLSDTNSDLIECYALVRDRPRDLVNLLHTYKNSSDFYYRIRAETPSDKLHKAARLLYLTRFAFNGIHRVNLKGQFNVPYGQKTTLSIVDEDNLLKVSQALKNVQLQTADFEFVTKHAVKDDLIYFDPPYTVAHANNGFVKYNEKIFSWDDQIRLAKHAKNLVERGCKVIISNADHPSIHTLYKDFMSFEIIERYSIIAASSENRRKITECVFYKRGN